MLRYLNSLVVYPLAERWEGRNIRRKVSALRREMQLPFDERYRRRLERLAQVLARAGQDVPYYRDLFRARRFDPAQVARDARYLETLPLLTKEIIREQGPRLLSRRFSSETLHPRKTGGSTGPSTVIYYDADALDWTAALNVVVHEWVGQYLGMKEVHLASRFPEAFPLKDRIKEHLKCCALRRANIFTDSFDARGLDRVWRRLRRIRPYLLQGHPSTLVALASYLRDRQIDATGAVGVFESTGEVLPDQKRELIESVFGCRTIDRFGSAEFGVVAYERLLEQQRRLLVVDAITWPETMSHESGIPELVLTGLLNDAMPLVRYRTGDLAELLREPDGFYLNKIVGRIHDVVQIGGQLYPTHYIQDLLGRLDGIEEFQLEQQPSRPLRVRLVVRDAARQPAISRRLKQWWGQHIELEFTDFAHLQRTGWRCKFRHLVSPPHSGVASADAAQHTAA